MNSSCSQLTVSKADYPPLPPPICEWASFNQLKALRARTNVSYRRRNFASRFNIQDFPGGAVDEDLPVSAGDMGSIPGMGR